MSVCCECYVLSGRGLCDELITRPEEAYRLWCVVVCDLEKHTSWMWRPKPTKGAIAPEKKTFIPSFPRSSGTYVDSSIHPLTSSMPVSLAFRRQRWRDEALHLIKWCWPITVCSQNGEIMLCDRNVSQGNHVQQADERLQQPRSLAGQSDCKWESPRFCDVLTASPWTFIVLKAPRSAVWTLTGWTLIGAKNVSNKSCWNKRNKFYILHFISITSLHERFITYTSDNRQCFSNIHRHTHTHSLPWQ